MEQQQQQQQQQHDNQYQYQTQNTTTTLNPTPQSYDYSSSQIQYDPQSYYALYPQQQYDNQNNLDYNNSNPNSSTTYDSSAYYYPNYSTSYQTYDPNSIHPPGVPLSADPQQTQLPNSQNYYYPPPQSQPYYQPGQPMYGGQVSQGGRSTRGRGRGTFGRGRGRGGRGVTPQTAAPAPSKPPPQMAWCEICRVDCNTLEILEKHKNGKKHMRNLKVCEELKNTGKPIMVTNQVSITQPELEGAQKLDMTEKSVLSVAQPSEETVRPDFSGGRGGLKRKMKGGRGGKRARVSDQQMVPILCELCNVKCESQVIYESHVAGKKHLSILKRYQSHKEALGEGVEALYPTIPNLPPSVPITHQTHQPVPQDAQALASMLIGEQNLRDPEAARAAVTELLNQHGIHDAQTLIAQLIPYLLTQSQEPGSALLPVAGFGSNDPYLQSQGLDKTTDAEGQNEETKTELQSMAGVGTSQKPNDGPPEVGKVEAE